MHVDIAILVYEVYQNKQRILGSLRSSLTTMMSVKSLSLAWGMIFFKSNPLLYFMSEFGITNFNSLQNLFVR